MNTSQNRVQSTLLYSIIFVFFLSLFYWVKFKGYLVTSYLFQNQEFVLLNKITGANTSGIKSLDFYIGEIENVLLGPLQSVISGLLFLIVSLKFLKKSSFFQFGAAVVAYLIITRPETLFYPPMGEGITGPFSDTIWLIQNKLNYFGLLKEDTFTKGGPQIYPTALYPFAVAVLMKLLANPKLFLFTMHILYFMMVGATLAFLREIGRKVFNDENFSLLIPLLVLYLPLSQCMVELLNLEVPSLFFTMLTAYYLTRDKIGAASLAALAALFVKDPGITACIAVFIVASAQYFTGTPKNHRKLIWPVLIMVIAAVKSYARTVIVGEQKSFNKVSFLCGWQNTWPSVWFYIFVLSLLGITLCAISRLKNQQEKSFKKLGHSLVSEHIHIFVMVLLTALWYLLYLNFLTLAYRYQFVLMPFLIFAAAYAVRLFVKNPVILQRAALFFILFALVSSHGLMYEWKSGVADNNKIETEPTNLERSLEYRNYIKLEMAMAKDIEKNFSDFAIVAPFKTAQVLGIPELGYVDKKMDVTVYGMRETLGIKPFMGLKYLDLRKTVFVGFPGERLEKIDIAYPIDPQDHILKKFESGHIEADIFMGGIAIEKMRILVSVFSKRNRRPNP